MSTGYRLRKHHLVAAAPAGSLERVAGEICGVHAQVLAAADLQLRCRVRRHAAGDLANVLWEQRTVVKTWLMRGTLHVLPAEDLPLYVGALDNRGEYANAWLKAFGTTAREMERLIAAIADALDGECLTRAELTAAVAPKVGKSAAKRLASGWGEFLKPASRRGALCFGPSRGQNVTFVRPDQWVGTWQDFGRDEARTELLRRFLAAYGPATPDDFERWIGSQRRIKEPWDALADELVELEPKRFALAADQRRLRARAAGVRLLPAFDPYVLFPHSDRPVPPDFGDRVYRKAAWVSQTILENGRVVGVWTHKQQGASLNVTVEPFKPLKPATKNAVRREAKSLAKYLGLQLAASAGLAGAGSRRS